MPDIVERLRAGIGGPHPRGRAHVATVHLDPEDVLAAATLIERQRAALDDIAEHRDCDGPGCPYCEEGPHPLSRSAIVARAALSDGE